MELKMKGLIGLGILLISSHVFADKAEIIFYKSGCDYFIADGASGYYLLEWQRGYDPSQGDTIVGQLTSFGFKDVYYPKQDREGRIYVEDYMLSKDRVITKYYEKCD